VRSLRTLLTIALAVPLLAATAPTLAEMAPYLHAQKLVDIGGRQLNVYCLGTGSPTVILDAGFPDSTESWYRVQRPLARTTRVCSYDRAGIGFSDGATTPRTPEAVVSDLHRLLHAAGIAPPYVLVGHSIAGLYEPLYADRYPREVGGLVLVDPSRPYQVRRLAAAAPALVQMMKQQQAEFHSCYAMLTGTSATKDEQQVCGFLSPADERTTCAKSGPGLCAYAKLQAVQSHRVLTLFDELGEFDSMMAGSGDIQAAQRYYGAMPLIVLTADDGPRHDRGLPPSIPPAQVAAMSSRRTRRSE
jgi:pimeloyl-ACP methyl ester carboxylesterase